MAKLCLPRRTAFLLAGVLSSCSATQTPGSGESMQPAQGDAALIDADEASEVSSAAGGRECPTSAPLSCPTPIPSFAQDVLPVLNAKCNGCHTGAPGEPWALGVWVDVNAWALSIAQDLIICSMPPVDAGAPVLNKAETDAILGWIVCGAPDN